MGKIIQIIQFILAKLICFIYREQLLILNYHRVLNQNEQFFSYDVDIELFNWQMSLLNKYFVPIHLSDAVEKLKSGQLPRGSVVVTFDDGYKDNIENALPILRKNEVPATFFIATGFLNGGIMWNDAIIEAIKQTQKKTLDLRGLNLPICRVDSVESKIKTIEMTINKIKYKTIAERQPLVKLIIGLCESNLPDNLMMTDNDISLLISSGMEIGGHTVNHPILSIENLNNVNMDIAQGKQYLENLSQQCLKSFAYPNGKINEDYKVEHVKLVEKNGFQCAVTTNWGLNTNKSDFFQLKRFTPWDRTPTKFLMRIFKLYAINKV